MATGTTVTGDVQFDQTAFNLAADFALRPQVYFDACATVQPTAQSMPGKAVTFPFVMDLPIASTSIDESTDIDPQRMSDDVVTVTLAEYGAAVRTSALVRGTSYVPFDPLVASVIGFNAGVSMDTIARDVLFGGTASVTYATGTGTKPTGRSTVTPANTITASDVREAKAFFGRNNVPPIGNSYVAYIHPDVSVDLRSQVAGSNWRDPHVYSDPGAIWNGEIGMFEGVRFVEASRVKVFADAGSSTTNTDVYATMFVGTQALAKAYSTQDGNGPMPRVFPGPVTDTLRRFVPMGWYWLGGYHLYRDASTVGYATRRLESASSIGQNTAAGTGMPSING